MKELYINGARAELSDKTIIALNIQSINVGDIEKRSLTHTNEFSLPFTAVNDAIFELARNPHSTSSVPYVKISIDYIENGMYIIKNGTGFLKSVKKSYLISIYESGINLIDSLKTITLNKLLSNEFVYAAPWWNYDLTGVTGPDYMNASTSVNKQANYKAGLCYAENQPITALDSMFIDGVPTVVSIPHIISLLSTYEGITVNGDITADVNYTSLVMSLNAAHRDSAILPNAYISTFVTDSLGYPLLTPETMSIYDLIKAIAQMFGCLIKLNDETQTVTLDLFSNIENATIVDWSEKLVDYDKIFDLGYAQKNYIKWVVDETFDPRLNAIQINSNNLNIKATQDLFEIDLKTTTFIDNPTQYTDPFLYIWGVTAFTGNSAGTPFLFKYDNTNLTSVQILVRNAYPDFTDFIPILEIPDTSSYYPTLAKILSNTVGYNATLNLNIADISSFDQTKRYAIQTLNEAFFVNKISGFNSSDPRPTKVELIKIT